LSVSLKHHTERQIKSLERYREEAALEALAVIADNPGNLPPFANLADGVCQIQDTLNVNAVTTFAHSASAFGFSTQNIAPSLGRSPKVQWNIAPVGDYTQLEALRCACRWAVYGPPENPCDACMSILADPLVDKSPGPHFGVLARLAKLPPHWLHVTHGCIPPPVTAKWRAHYGDTWVWVAPEDVAALNEFILTLLDISTLNLDQGNPADAPPILVHLKVTEKTKEATHLYDLSQVSRYKLQKEFQLNDPQIDLLYSVLKGAFDVSENDYVAAIKSFLTGDNIDQRAKGIAELAQQPATYDFNEMTDSRLILAGFNEKRVETMGPALRNLPLNQRVYFGSRADVRKQFLENMNRVDQNNTRILSNQLSENLSQVEKENAKNVSKHPSELKRSDLDRLLDYFQVAPSSLGEYRFDRIARAADYGLTPQQVQRLWNDARLDTPFLGTEEEFASLLKRIAEVRNYNEGFEEQDLRVYRKMAAAAKVALSYPYSKDVIFEQDRVIRPEYLEHIRTLVQTAPPGNRAVAISWDDWMNMSSPFHGARNNVKPDATITTPSAAPARAVPPRVDPLLEMLGPPPLGNP